MENDLGKAYFELFEKFQDLKRQLSEEIDSLKNKVERLESQVSSLEYWREVNNDDN